MSLRSVLTPHRFGMARYDDPLWGMQRALQKSFDDIWHHGGQAAPTTQAAAMSVRMDVKEDAKAYHLTADLPGLNEAEVEVTFDNDTLTIRGEKKVARDETKDTWHIVERSSGSFARQLSFPTPIDQTAIAATFDKGVLSITLPKAAPETVAARKITITTGG
jgi:HSP20 family protein